MDKNRESDLPSLKDLTPGTRLHSFVSNPNLQSDKHGNYFIDYTDPNYVETGEDYTSGELASDELSVVVRVNFETRTAVLEIGEDACLDVSHNYFSETFLDS